MISGGVAPRAWLREPVEQWEASIIDFPKHPIPSEERELQQIALAANTVDFLLLYN